MSDENAAMKILQGKLVQYELLLKNYKDEFDRVEQDITNATTLLKSLGDKREQIRGSYTTIFNEYNNLKAEMLKSNLLPKVETPTEPKVETPMKDETTEIKPIKPKANKKKDGAETAGTLTPEEVKTIQNKIGNKELVKESDIPEYLLDEYKK